MQNFIKKVSFFLFSSSSNTDRNTSKRTIISRKKHGISRKQIDKHALDVLYGLKRAGYDAYLVGGAVRDLMLGIEPKDFDVVTNAEPEQVKQIFKKRCRLIGRRFRLAHVGYGRNIVEVATFRGDGEGEKKISRKQLNNTRATDDTGKLLRDNVYGTINEDIWRRDFTVNSLYYNIKDFSIIDYAGAEEDIKKGQLRLIGDPKTRYREDPVRMIRAIRFAAKLGFDIEQKTKDPIYEMGSLLKNVSHARMFEEVLKLFHSGFAVEVFEKLRQFGLFKYIFPQTHHLLSLEEQGFPRMLVIEALKSTDQRIQAGKSVNPSFLFAAMLWEPMKQRMEQHLAEDFTHQDALYAAANDVIREQIIATSIPKRFTAQMREIWSLQFRLPKNNGVKSQKLQVHRRFRAAYDFLGVRVLAGETELKELFDWWTVYQQKNPLEQVAYANNLQQDKYPKKTNLGRNPYRKRRDDSEE
jgi:poly(A) polymerase